MADFTDLCHFLGDFGGTIPSVVPVRGVVGLRAISKHFADTSDLVREACMEEVTAVGKSVEQHAVHHENRNCWIFTAYAICGVVFFGVLAYYTSLYLAK